MSAERPDLSRAQLFLDDTWIAEATLVNRRWHEPRRFPDPVLTAEHPWERWCPVMYGTVLHWRGKFRMWYCAWSREPRPRVCYAESDDGVAWEKPRLGLCDFNGSTDNNIVLDPIGENHLIDDCTVIDDPEDGEWPLKILFWHGHKHDPVKKDWGIHLARSKDGVNWDRSPGLVLPVWNDRFNAVSIKLDGKYVVLGRAPGSRVQGRQVWRTESSDLRNWSEPKRVLVRDIEDPLRMEYYSATAFPYESLLLGSIERMHMTPDRLDTELIWSHDNGWTWQRARTRPSFLTPLETSPWQSVWVNLPTNGPIRNQNRLWFYYSARSGAHGTPYPLNYGALGLALLRIDGFASICAGEKPGTILTPVMEWTGGELFVNADPRRDLTSHPGFVCGEVRVEVRDETNHVVPGFSWDDCTPLNGNTVNEPDSQARVGWKDEKSTRALARQRDRLAFRLRDAHLYSFRAR